MISTQCFKISYYLLIISYLILVQYPFSYAEVGKAEIFIDFSNKKKINKMVFGHNSLSFNKCRKKYIDSNCTDDGFYSNFGAGQWDPLRRLPNKELLSLANNIKMTSLRYPGGCGTHHFNWKETIGNIKDRPTHQFGIDEFLSLCRAIGAEPIITLSYFTGSDKDLADLIEYLNNPVGEKNYNGGVDWAKVRAENGHNLPYNVKYFEMGNEVWHGDHVKIGSVSPEEYATRYLELNKKLKEIDPRILLGAVFKPFHSANIRWFEVLCNQIGKLLDFSIIHIYPVGYRSNKNILSSENLYKIAFASPGQIKIQLEDFNEKLRTCIGKDVPIAITEVNGGFVQEYPIPYRHTLANALLNANLLMVLMSVDINILSVNNWHFSNSYWGMISGPKLPTKNKKYFKRPIFLVYELFSNFFNGYLLEAKVLSQSYQSKAFSRVFSTYKSLPSDTDDDQKNKRILLTPELWQIKHFPGVNVKRKKKEIIVSYNNVKNNNHKHVSIISINSIPIKSFHDYRVICEIKAEALTSIKGVRLAVTDSRGWRKTHWVKMTHPVTGDTRWKKQEIIFKAMGEGKNINIDIRKNKDKVKVNGTIRIRNVVLEDLGKSKKYLPTSYITAIASKNDEENKLYLLVLNKNLDDNIEADIQISNFVFSPKINIKTLSCHNLSSTNEKNHVEIKIKKNTIISKNNASKIKYKFKKHSLTLIELTDNK